MSDLDRAVAALKDKQDYYCRLFDYYDGNQPVVYTNERLRDIFKNIDMTFVENWCAVVVDACADRLSLENFTVNGNQEAQNKLAELWAEYDIALEGDDAHLAALITGESSICVWREDDELHIYYNDPRLVHVFYDPDNPRRIEFAAKWWVGTDGKRYLTLYYTDKLEYYVSTKESERVEKGADFQPDPEMPTAENPFDEVPVFHFRPSRRMVKSDLTDVIPPQDGINKLLIDMMVAAEYGAFKQRYIISNADNLGKLKNAPNEIWDVPAGDGQGQQTSVGEFSATELKNYFDAIDNLAMAIGAITRTPKHYFFTQTGDPSGESLMAMEAPLVKKTQDRIDRFIPTWKRLAAFLLKLEGMDVKPSAITPNFADPHTIQPLLQAQIRKTNSEAGVPVKTQLRDEGWTEKELNQMDEDKGAMPPPPLQPSGAIQ